jgi:hypothetical protein
VKSISLGPREPVGPAALQPVERPRHAALHDRQVFSEQKEAEGEHPQPEHGKDGKKAAKHKGQGGGG